MTEQELYSVLKRLSHCLTKQSLSDYERVHDAKGIVLTTMEQIDADNRCYARPQFSDCRDSKGKDVRFSDCRNDPAPKPKATNQKKERANDFLTTQQTDMA